MKRRKWEAGVTLVEMTIVLVITAIISAGTLFFTKPIIDLWGVQNFEQGRAAEARLAVLRAVREMNQLKDKRSVVTANGTTYSFINGSNTTITYLLSGTQLQRREGASTNTAQMIADGVTSFAFTYWNKNGSTITTPIVGSASDTDIRRIDMSLTAATGSKTAPVRGEVHPRNVLE